MKADIQEILPYNFAESEQKWADEFTRRDLYSKDSILTSDRPKYYVLEMFPYPSGKIHMGHVRNYTFGDVIARYKRLKGFNVLHPMGWDAFGLPAENAALERKVHPKDWTYKNIEYMKSQLKKLHLSYNWDVEFATCDREYYAYQQKLFVELYKKGYIYRKFATVNWDPVDNCVLANEQVIDGKGWRSGAEVEKRELSQWFMRITDFADELLEDLNKLSGWPDKVRLMQENWIGKSHGTKIKFSTNNGKDFEVFSTRADTLYGASFIALSADHEISKDLAEKDDKIKDFVNECLKGSVSAEVIEKLEKKGIDTGLTAKNPVTGQDLPIYIANFVLSGYGTGAIFGAPGHDQRDYDFAKKYDLPIIKVVSKLTENGEEVDTDLPYTGDGVMINSDILNGLTPSVARDKITEILSEKGLGSKETIFRLRDWGLSRQRYWGCPIPIIQCPNCGDVPCSDDMLPVYLPDDVTFDKQGNPLERHPTWREVICPHCGAKALRDTDTMDTFVDSSWYFMRFVQELYGKKDLSMSEIDKWLPVDQYVGGIEHAILHLLYARFFTKVLAKEFDGKTTEPFKNLLTQGMVGHETYRKLDGSWVYPDDVEMTKDGKFIESKTGDEVVVGRSEKMSKSKKNVVDPDKIISSYGSDSVRFFVVSDTPPEKDFDWTSEGLDGCWRFVNRFWRLYATAANSGVKILSTDLSNLSSSDKNLSKLITEFHKGVKDIGDALDANAFNRAVAYIRDLVNKLYNNLDNITPDVFGPMLANLSIMVSPFMPCLAEETWALLGGQDLACMQKWPEFSEKLLQCDTMTLPVQVNGKLRANIEVASDASEDEIFATALSNEKIVNFVSGKEIRKKIYVKGKIVNLVV